MFPEPVKIIRVVPMGGLYQNSSVKRMNTGLGASAYPHRPAQCLANLEGAPEQQPFDGDATKFTTRASKP